MIACVRVPYFAALCEVRALPHLDAVPFVVGEPALRPHEVVGVSPLAAAAGVRPGQRVSQAHALCPGLEVVPARQSLYRRTYDELLEAFTAFTGLVEAEAGLELRADARPRKRVPYLPAAQLDDPPAATCFLDLGTLAETDGHDVARQLAEVTELHAGQRPAIGLASGKFVARVAAMSCGEHGLVLVGTGREAAFLADFPVSVLPVDGETLRQLHLLGLTTLGQVAALPAHAVLDRFGREGRSLHRLAAGHDTSRVAPYQPRRIERLVVPFEPPVVDRTILAAALRRAVQTLVARLQGEGQVACELSLVLELEGGTLLERNLSLREPTANVHTLCERADDLLTAMPVTRGIVGMELGLGGISPAVARQLSLFARQPVPQEELQRVLADLAGRYGDDCFYWARLTDPQARLPERRFRFEPALVIGGEGKR